MVSYGGEALVDMYLCPPQQIEAKVILARLLQTFKVTLQPSYKLVVVEPAALQPKGGVPCTLEEIAH